MKKILFKIKEYFKNYKSKYHNTLNPHFYWKILLYVFSVFMAVLIFFSFYLLFQIKEGEIFQVPLIKTEETNKVIQNTLLKKVQESFDNKASNEALLKQTPLSIPDPSL